nr:MAG TPA: hypothetical protein [Bacteriophage sp.]
MQFLAIIDEHASECERIFEPGACLYALVVIGEVVIPDVELLEIGHLKRSSFRLCLTRNIIALTITKN